MTEAEWLTCTNPDTLLDHHLQGGVSERKLRLFACACCRRIWELLEDERSRHAVETAERYADGRASIDDLQRALRSAEAIPARKGNRAAKQAARHTCFLVPDHSRPEQAGYAGYPGEEADVVAMGIARSCAEALHGVTSSSAKDAWLAWYREGKPHADLLREVFGNPFRPVRLDPGWLASEGGAVVQVAEGIHEDRAFDHMAILADAFEEAGCTDTAILDHCKKPHPHTRGCWLLDAILGRS